MEFFLALLVLTAGILQCQAMQIFSRNTASCGVALNQTMYGPVNITTFGCPGAKGAIFSPPPAPGKTRRQAGACTMPAPICQSGVITTNFDVCNGEPNAAPNLTDCSKMAAFFFAGNTGTFLVEPLTLFSSALGTCEFRWGNLDNITHEFSFHDFGNLGLGVYTRCITEASLAGGFVVAENNLWFGQTIATLS